MGINPWVLVIKALASEENKSGISPDTAQENRYKVKLLQLVQVKY